MTHTHQPLLLALFTLAVSCLGCGSSSSTPAGDGSPDAGDGDGAAALDGSSGPEPCSTPGETRAAACGNCGIQGQTCSRDHVWEPSGPCTDQGECSPGSTETRDDAFCGQSARTCDNTCAWRAWSETVPPGVCEVDDTRVRTDGCPLSQYRVERCLAQCQWSDAECANPCGGERRTDPPDAEEICIPQGFFVRGDETFEDAQPVAEVYLTAYYIDRFPVTNARYAECTAAGVCPAPWDGLVDFLDPAAGRRPVLGVPLRDAETFCAWDGHRIPTEAEWEKAARGPSPRQQPFSWEGPDFRCLEQPSRACDPTWDRSAFAVPYDVDALPSSASFYGVELQLGGGYEATRDNYDSTYYSDPRSLTDPAGPVAGDFHVVRGAHHTRADPSDWRVARRWQARGPLPEVPTHLFTLRCARTAM